MALVFKRQIRVAASAWAKKAVAATITPSPPQRQLIKHRTAILVVLSLLKSCSMATHKHMAACNQSFAGQHLSVRRSESAKAHARREIAGRGPA